MKVLFICLGNICRSPLAEAIFNHKILEKGPKDSVRAESCGTANYHIGDRPDPRTIKNAIRNGIDIHHRGRQLTDLDIEEFDLLLAMDQNNLDDIFKLPRASEFKFKIKLLREYDPYGIGDVPDPYYGVEKDFQQVFDILNRSMDRLIDQLMDKQKLDLY